MGASILSAHDQPVEWKRLSFPSYICTTIAYNGTINVSFKFFYDLFFFYAIQLIHAKIYDREMKQLTKGREASFLWRRCPLRINSVQDQDTFIYIEKMRVTCTLHTINNSACVALFSPLLALIEANIRYVTTGHIPHKCV